MNCYINIFLLEQLFGSNITVLESRASVKRKDVVRRPTAEEDCLTPITSRRSGACKATGIHLNYRLTRSKIKQMIFLTIRLR